ncbi:MAG: PD40 domain-containing protein [Prevotella sp.]|nr:PD40 domain-containing protein [Prevotella sp.]
MRQLLTIISIITIAISGCTSLPDHPTKSQELPKIVPDYIGVTIPDGIAPLNFYIDTDEDNIERMDVIVTGAKGGTLHSNGDYADFDIDEWHSLLRQNKGDSLRVTVSVKRNGEWTEYKPFAIHISNDPIGAWGITYRLIPPGYETYGTMGLYQRCLSTFEETAIIENKQVESNCVNCHTPNQTNPNQSTFHVRGEHGATVVCHDGKIDILTPRNDELGGSMVYPYWHPSGRFIAYSTNQTHQNFHQLSNRRVEVYDDSSDIIIYDPSTHDILLDSIVATRDHLENYPAFSPDGKTLYFCAANRTDSIWKNYMDVKYNICRIDFHPETGLLGSRVDTIVNARNMGKSANMPRISYDGKYLLYTLSDYGCFPIWHPEADLWMMDIENGNTWPLSHANSEDAESFHNWSLNSRWVVFTSRRDNGLYTQLYLVHIDEQGKADKPFRLPQRNPREHDAETIYSFNTPDFATRPIDLSNQGIYQRLMGNERVASRLKMQD